MEYYFNNITPVDFQRLINAILLARFGEDLRVTPLRGADGGRDSETAPGNPHLEVDVSSNSTHAKSPLAEPRLGRYLFQVKHHNTNEMRPSDARKKVLDEFEEELTKNVLTSTERPK